MKKVLIFTGLYLPGVKGGGPIQSIKNLVDNLSETFNFYIVTQDRDMGDTESYHGIKVDQWVMHGKANVLYLNKNDIGLKRIHKIIKEIKPDTIYLNSFFSAKFSILPIILNKMNVYKPFKVVLAPRGEFSPGALSIKPRKKQLYIKIAKLLNFYNRVWWQGTNKIELDNIKDYFGPSIQSIEVSNLTSNYKDLLYKKNLEKNPGELKLVSISRIHPMKNLKMTLEILSYLKGSVIYNIYGPIEDQKYWEECKKIIEKLPKNINVHYNGIANQSNVCSIYHQNHVMILPTLGENFGHAISEALIGGCPVVISDQTPWKNLADKSVGWDIPLDNKEKYIDVLQNYIRMGNVIYINSSKKAFDFAKANSNSPKVIKNYYKLLSNN